MDFFTSDTHFGHQRIIEFCNRPFASVEEMNEGLIERFNAVVGPKDRLFILGDVALGKIADSLPLVGRLNGIKILIPGNHDRVFSGARDKDKRKFADKYAEVFDAIFPEQIIHKIGDRAVRLCHFPHTGDSLGEERYTDLRPVDDGIPLLHGHVHDAFRILENQFNVGVDVNNFTPVSEDEVAEIIKDM